MSITAIIGGQWGDEGKGKIVDLLSKDANMVYTTDDLASGDVMFSATGVTNGTLLQGVLIKNNIATTQSVVMRSKTKTLRYVNARHDLRIKDIVT